MGSKARLVKADAPVTGIRLHAERARIAARVVDLLDGAVDVV